VWGRIPVKIEGEVPPHPGDAEPPFRQTQPYGMTCLIAGNQEESSMQDTTESRNLSVPIHRDVAEAYAFLSVPENFPKWATGLGVLRKTGEDWVTETPEGPMKVRFSDKNPFGVLDHWVSPTPDTTLYIPMRVVRNGTGCELILTLFRLPGMSDEKFAADAEWVMRDLRSAKEILEAERPWN
jgi:hypothetical protein